MSFKHLISACTHPGRVAKNNEDYHVVDHDLGLLILADGMGGHAGGEHASRLAATSTLQACRDGETLLTAIRQAHDEVLRAMAEDDRLHNMGTTLVVLVLAGTEYELAWVGDSRAYHWRDGCLQQLTRDHNYAETLIAHGLSRELAWRDTQAARLTQAIGVRPEMGVDPDTVYGQLYRDEYLLLCSDGLSNELSDAEIAALIQPTSSTEMICENLVQAALDKGGRDNITVLLARAAADAPRRPSTDRGAQRWYRRLLFWRRS